MSYPLYNVCFAIAFILLTGCTQSPEKRLEEYLKYSFLRHDEHKAYLMLASEDRKYKTEKEFVEEIQHDCSYSKNFITKNQDFFGFKIIKIDNTNADTVKIKVLIEKPNSEKLLESILTLSVIPQEREISADKREKVMEKQLEALLKKPDLTKQTEEKEYTLIRENGSYSVYLNLGYSNKKAEMDNLMVKMEKIAEEKIRKIDYQGALSIYQKIQSLVPKSGIEYRIDEMNTILEKTTQLGQQIPVGNLLIKPLEVELKKALLYKKNWGGNKPIIISTPEPCMMLTFEIANIGDGEVFNFFDSNRFKRKNCVRDNFGNEMKEYFLDFDILSIEGNNLKPIKPGEKRKIVAICEATLSPKASRFLWEMNLLTDNKKTENNIFITFTRGQIKGGE